MADLVTGAAWPSLAVIVLVDAAGPDEAAVADGDAVAVSGSALGLAS